MYPCWLQLLPMEVAAFIHNFMWGHDELPAPGLSDYFETQAAMVLVDVNESLPADTQRQYLLPEDIPAFVHKVLDCRPIFASLATTNLLANTLLLRSFLSFSEGPAKVGHTKLTVFGISGPHLLYGAQHIAGELCCWVTHT